MPDKRRKTLDWFLAMVESYGASYEAGTRHGCVIVTAANGRTMTLTEYDLETLSRRALTKRFERLARDPQPPPQPFPFVPAVES